ncbi:MAG TPA: zinc ribbon domain-containing protein [Candidatus Binataceae bacterium]
MPIYEWRCAACEITFEALEPAVRANSRKRCPQCGRAARRAVSTFAISSGNGAVIAARRAAAGLDITNLKVPPFARLCGMDDHSASRFAAYKLGRGAEFDDKIQARAEQREARGEPPPKPPRNRGGHHRHGPRPKPAPH